MSNQGNGKPVPIQNGPRITGGVGHVFVDGSVVQGVNLPNGQGQTPDGKIHK